MKNKNKKFIIFFVFLFNCLSLYASNDTDMASSLQKLSAQTEELQQEVQTLKAELAQKHAEKLRAENQIQMPTTDAPCPCEAQARSKPKLKKTQPQKKCYTCAKERKKANSSGSCAPCDSCEPAECGSVTMEEATEIVDNTTGQHYHLGFPVTTGPYIGLRTAYDASDLIINYPTMNEDLRLLLQRQSLEQDLEEQGISSSVAPYMILSGAIEGQVFWQNQHPGATATVTSSAASLSRAELDSYINVGPWAQGFMSFSYDNSALPGDENSGNPIANSRIYLQRGFATIGNLDRTPIYFTIGQFYVPFGRYASYFITDPDTKLLFRSTERAVLLGYYHDGLYLSAYGFNGMSMAHGSSKFDSYGGNAGYKFSGPVFSGNFGAGLIKNVADSILMQNTGLGSGSFEGFGESVDTENITHQVPGADIHGELDIKKLYLITEYITSTRSFDALDLTFNNSGAKPRAWRAEADYGFKLWDRPSLVGIAYDESWEALALGLPKNSYSAVFSISIWKNTIESFEFRHDVNYPATDVAGGICDTSPTGFCTNPPVGGSNNTVIGQLGVYF